MNNTFSNLWDDGLADAARAAGVRDGDLNKIRAKVKATLVSATWADNEGKLCFANDADMAACLQTARAVVDSESPKYAHSHLKASLQGQHPNKTSLSAFLNPVTPDTMISAGFSPVMAKPGDRCPNCSGNMLAVELVNQKPGLFCPADRVCLPLSTD